MRVGYPHGCSISTWIFLYHGALTIAKNSLRKTKTQHQHSLNTHKTLLETKCKLQMSWSFYKVQACDPAINKWCFNIVRHRFSSTQIHQRRLPLRWNLLFQCFVSKVFSVICYTFTEPFVLSTKLLNASVSMHIVTPNLRLTSSFIYLSILVTPRILPKHFFSLLYSLRLSTIILYHVSAQFDTVGTTALSYSSLFIPKLTLLT